MPTFTITNKQRAKATIVMLIDLYGKQYKKSIGIGLPAKYWNSLKKRAKVTADFDGKPINDTIDAWHEIGRSAEKYFTEKKYAPTQQEFLHAISEIVPSVTKAQEQTDIPQANIYFCDYFEHTYIPRYACVRRSDTVKKYYTALHKLRDYEAAKKQKLTFEQINIDFYNNFQTWFYGCKFSANYFGNIVKIIKQVYREARICDKLHMLEGTEHHDFIAPKEASDSVYLNLTELDNIYNLEITAQTIQTPDDPLTEDNLKKKITALNRARGLFLIGCYTGLRVSDFSRLRDAHIGQYITIKTSKTGASVIIPIHPTVRAILNSGFDLTDTISDQKLNDQLKELCRLASITEDILVNRNEGGKSIEVVLPKYKLVSSHTARRSFATNAYKAGVPTIAIMKITGHTKESTFLKYIKVSAHENAEMLSHHPFFLNASKQDE